MLNRTTTRTVQPLVQKTFFGLLIGFLLAPMMLSFGQQPAGGLPRFYSKESKVGFRYPVGTVKRVDDKMVFNLLETVVRTLYFGK